MKKLILFALIVLTVLSCEYKKGLLPTPEPFVAGVCDSIKYTNGIKAIIDNNCVSCHSGSIPSANLDLTTYANVKAIALNGSLKKRAIDADPLPMPQAGLLPQSQLDSVQCWITNGALQ